MRWAFDELLSYAPDGIQLTPGNAPTVDFTAYYKSKDILIRTHHGFTPKAMRHEVWDENHILNGQWDSIHPPRLSELDWWPSTKSIATNCFEVMYPGQNLGNGISVDRAMDENLNLAIDVSHIHIQLTQETMTEMTWRRLQDYPYISEIHISANNGKRDQHHTIDKSSFGLEWACKRTQSDKLPLILESYWHNTPEDDRKTQLNIIRKMSS